MNRFFTPQVVLYAIFLISLCWCGIAIQHARAIDYIFAVDEDALWISLLEVYSVPIGALVAGSLAGVRTARQAWKKTGFVVVLAVLWNAILIWKYSSIVGHSPPSRDEVVGFVDLISQRAGFLIAGVLTFFAVRSAKS